MNREQAATERIGKQSVPDDAREAALNRLRCAHCQDAAVGEWKRIAGELLAEIEIWVINEQAQAVLRGTVYVPGTALVALIAKAKGMGL
jgi:hypothetical protein